jgi:uracil-DNA glycosylase
MQHLTFTNPSPDCPLCPRLCEFRATNRVAFPNYRNAPAPAFGELDAKILIVGLAPGLHGANASGRPFTGDYAGQVLYPALLKHGLAEGHYDATAKTGNLPEDFRLKHVRITNAVRCVPPENKPTPEEIRTCNPFLRDEVAAMPNLRVILSLGSISHSAVLRAFGLKASAAKFGHAAEYSLYQAPAAAHTVPHMARASGSSGLATSPEVAHAPATAHKITLLDSYHTSRYNINTGRLTVEMFDSITARLAELIHAVR